MPMLPEVESSRRFPGASSPFASAVRRMLSAGRSLTEPPGLNHSALANTCTRGGRCLVTRRSGMRGVFPTWFSNPAWVDVSIFGGAKTVVKLNLQIKTNSQQVNEKDGAGRHAKNCISHAGSRPPSFFCWLMQRLKSSLPLARVVTTLVVTTFFFMKRRWLQSPPQTHASEHSNTPEFL